MSKWSTFKSGAKKGMEAYASLRAPAAAASRPSASEGASTEKSGLAALGDKLKKRREGGHSFGGFGKRKATSSTY